MQVLVWAVYAIMYVYIHMKVEVGLHTVCIRNLYKLYL